MNFLKNFEPFHDSSTSLLSNFASLWASILPAKDSIFFILSHFGALCSFSTSCPVSSPIVSCSRLFWTAASEQVLSQKGISSKKRSRREIISRRARVFLQQEPVLESATCPAALIGPSVALRMIPLGGLHPRSKKRTFRVKPL